MHKIEEIFVVVTIHQDGEEGIMGEMIDGSWTPFVTSQQHILAYMQGVAEHAKKTRDIDFKIKKFRLVEE